MSAKKVLSTSTPTKKPSLASLKPEKGKNVRAQKKAVKKIEANVSKKHSTQKSPIVVRKKTETTGLGVKRVTRQKKTKASSETDMLVLPTNMSIRAREKALVILDQITKDFNKSAQQVAYVSGLCFMLLGATMSLAFSGALSSQNQSAQLASSTLQTTTSTVSSTINIPPPEISLLDPLPRELTTTTEHKLAVLNVKNVDVRARSLDTGKIISLPIDDLSSELYKFSLDRTKFDGGTYSIIAIVESSFDSSKHDFKLGEVVVMSETRQTTNSDTASSTTVTDETAVLSETEALEDTGSLDDVADAEDEATDNASDVDVVASTTINTVTPNPTTPTLKLILPGSALSDSALIKVDAPKDLPFIEMYVRQPQASQKQLVGLAEKHNDYWYFFFKTIDVPNGDYEIIARTRVSGRDYFSSGSKIQISNFVKESRVVYETPENTTEDEELENDENAEAPLSIGRSLPDLTLSNVNELEEADSLTPTAVTVQDILAKYAEDIKTLLNRYAVAKQSGDALAIELAVKEIEAGKRRIINAILLDKSINYLADDAEKALNERFAILQKRVETFEELRKAASDGTTSVDTDKDGISDFDELNLYNTDPNIPDTDNDGVIDGVEIMRGFDPLNSDVQSVISYELPEESLGLVQEDVFKVETVVPYILNDDETGKIVQTEIVGKALPNSYVTLYVFSTPTIVTVRADENGAFRYTFEKELEDGNHEVYVAMTDNTGAIVARSNPFRFIKKAEAFTPIEANAIESSPVTSLASFNTYNTVVGLGILAFGIILLMLGVSIREKTGVPPDAPSHDLKTS